MKPLAILVAEDVIEIRDLIHRCLASAGHSVAGAAGGVEALRLLAQQHFDLLITDLRMPDGDGRDVITGIKNAKSAVRILVISGGGQPFRTKEGVCVAENLGAHAVLYKPFVRSALFEAIDRAMTVESPAT